MQKVIDFTRKGNLVRLYLGGTDLTDWGGDDWNDRPYEHNAGTVYDSYISGVLNIYFPFDFNVYEPADDYNYRGNSPYCKDDFKNGGIPFIVASQSDFNYSTYKSDLNGKEHICLYMGMSVPDNLVNKIIPYSKLIK